MPDEFRRKRKLAKLSHINMLYGWGTWIRTKIDGVGVPIEPLILFNYLETGSKPPYMLQWVISVLQTERTTVDHASANSLPPRPLAMTANWPRSHAGKLDRDRPINTPTARHYARGTSHGRCRSVLYVPASARRNVHSRAGAVTRPAKAARRVRFGDGCPSWQISTDCAPSPVKSSTLALRYWEGRRVR